MDNDKYLEISDKVTEIAISRGYKKLVGSEMMIKFQEILVEEFGEKIAKEYNQGFIANLESTALYLKRLVDLCEELEPISFIKFQDQVFQFKGLDYIVFYESYKIESEIIKSFEKYPKGAIAYYRILVNNLKSRISDIKILWNKNDRKERTRKKPATGISVFETNLKNFEILEEKYILIIEFIESIVELIKSEKKTENSNKEKKEVKQEISDKQFAQIEIALFYHLLIESEAISRPNNIKKFLENESLKWHRNGKPISWNTLYRKKNLLKDLNQSEEPYLSYYNRIESLITKYPEGLPEDIVLKVDDST